MSFRRRLTLGETVTISFGEQKIKGDVEVTFAERYSTRKAFKRQEIQLMRNKIQP